MLPENSRWKLNAMLRLFALLCIGVFAGQMLIEANDAVAERLSSMPAVTGSPAGKIAVDILTLPSRMDRNLRAHIVSFLSLQGLALVWITLFVREHQMGWAQAFGLRRAPGRSVLTGVGVTLVALPIATVGIGSLVLLLLKLMGVEPDAQTTVTLIKAGPPAWQLALFGLAAVVLAPIAEETLFRGILYPALKQRGYHALAWGGTAVLFGMIHLNLAAFLPLTFLALVFTWLYERTGNLLAPIIGHCMFNGLNFVALVSPPKWLEPFLTR